MHEEQAPRAAPREPDRPRHRRSLPLYVGAGGVATAAHYFVTIVAVEAFAVMPIVASAGGFATGAAIKYWLNYSLAFRSRARHLPALARFLVALAALMALYTGLFALFKYSLGMHYLVAQVLTTIVLILPGYLAHRQWVFRP
jgi:putative flippase GtrA